MKDYWLAKLISSVPEVDSRKRLQKSLYLLQLAGCPLQCDYLLHYYGPYSFELAGLIDQLDAANIITENAEELIPGVVRYKSAITKNGKTVIESFEKTKVGQKQLDAIDPFIARFKTLNQLDLSMLELTATVAYYHENDWQVAQKQTAKFKKVSPNDKNLRQAAQLASSFKK